MGKKAAKKAEAPAPASKKAQEEEEEVAPAAEPAAAQPTAAGAIAEAAEEAVGKDHAKPEVIQFTPEAAAQYDLTAKITPYLDRHLILPILNFLQEVGMYNTEDVSRAELKILSETCLIDLAIDKYASIGEEVPESLNERRDEVVHKIQEMRDTVLELLEVLEDSERMKRINVLKSLEDVYHEFDLAPEVIDKLPEFAKLKFDSGDYRVTSILIPHCRMFQEKFLIARYGEITAQMSDPVAEKYVSSYWGSLACGLLDPGADMDDNDGHNERRPPGTIDYIVQLDDLLEKSKAPKREVLLHRTWLLHWTLFAIFSADKVDKATDQQWPKLLEFFLSEKSLSIISLSCPHLFRYVGACLILQKRLKRVVPETVWIINNESGSYSDPVTRFLVALYTEMDFDDAQGELQKCELVCKGDFFLAPHWAEFQENARLHIFESYCRTHQCINIQMIASKLNMEAVDAELWIVKLIQNAKLDARIDSEKSRVVMTKAPPNVYQQVIEKTKNLAFRSTMLVSNLDEKR